MKIKKKILLLIINVLLLVFFSGCGASIATTMQVSDGFSGSRVMQMSIPKSDFNEYVHTDIDTLNSGITGECPTDIQFTYEEQADKYVYNFTIAFTSLDDYKVKVNNLLGTDFGAQIIYLTPETVFANGFELEENFASSDLMQWFSNYLLSTGYVDAEDSSYIFETKSAVLLYNDLNYTTYDTISVNNMSFVPLNKIDFFTTKNNDQLSKDIYIDIPQSSMDIKGDDITAFLEKNVPTGATSEWVAGESNQIFEIHIPMCGINEMNEAMKIFTQSEDTTLTLDQASTSEYPFGYCGTLNEQLDLSAYLSNDYNQVCSNYYIAKDKNTLTASYTANENVSELYPYETEEYPNFYLVSSSYDLQYSLSSLISSFYQPSEVNVTTKIQGINKVDREIQFLFNETPTEQEQEKILSNLQNICQNNIEIKTSNADDQYIVTLTQKGSMQDVSDKFLTVFGGDGSITYGKELGVFKVIEKFGYIETLDFGQFLKDNVDAELTHVVKTGGEINRKTIQCSADDGYSIDKGNATYTTSGLYANIQMEGTRINIIAIIIWIIILAITITFVIRLIPLIKGINIGSNKNKKVVIKPFSELNTVKPKFCEECGEDLQDGIYCPNCGRHI